MVGRPPLALFSLFLLLCAVGLIVLDVLVNKSPPNNPDVEKHWNKLLLELSGLEFCIINSSNARLMAESYASAHVLRGLDDIKSDNVIISHAIHLPLSIYPNEEFVYDMSYLLIAKMYGRHIGIKGMLQFSYQLQCILFYTEYGSMKNIVILLKQSWSVET